MIPYAQVAAFDDPVETDRAWIWAGQDARISLNVIKLMVIVGRM